MSEQKQICQIPKPQKISGQEMVDKDQIIDLDDKEKRTV